MAIAEAPEAILFSEKDYIQLWMKKTGKPNPFSLSSRVGLTMPLADGKVLIKETGVVVKIGEDKRVSLVGSDGDRDLGVTLYELTREHLK